MLPERGAHVAQPSTGQKSAMEGNSTTASRERWNKGRIVGQKAPFRLKEFRAAQLLPAHSRLELIVRCLESRLTMHRNSRSRQRFAWPVSRPLETRQGPSGCSRTFLVRDPQALKFLLIQLVRNQATPVPRAQSPSGQLSQCQGMRAESAHEFEPGFPRLTPIPTS